MTTIPFKVENKADAYRLIIKYHFGMFRTYCGYDWKDKVDELVNCNPSDKELIEQIVKGVCNG
jgi:hypothetical protein